MGWGGKKGTMEVLFLDKSLLCILAQSIAHGHASSPQQYPTHAGIGEQNPVVIFSA